MFTTWYSAEVQKQMELGKAETEVDLRLSVLNPLHATWLVSLYNNLLAFSKIKKIASAPHSIPHSVWRYNALLLAPIHGLRHGKSLTYCASDVILQYLSWSSTNHMPCNLSQFKELF